MWHWEIRRNSDFFEYVLYYRVIITNHRIFQQKNRFFIDQCHNFRKLTLNIAFQTEHILSCQTKKVLKAAQLTQFKWYFICFRESFLIFANLFSKIQRLIWSLCVTHYLCFRTWCVWATACNIQNYFVWQISDFFFLFQSQNTTNRMYL